MLNRVLFVAALPLFVTVGLCGLTGYFLTYTSQSVARYAVRTWATTIGASTKKSIKSRGTAASEDEETDTVWTHVTGKPLSLAEVRRRERYINFMQSDPQHQRFYKFQWWLNEWVDLNLSPWEKTARGLQIFLRDASGSELDEAAARVLDEDVDTPTFAAWGLNLLPWRKLHVRSQHRRAHATILRREDKFSGNEDVVKHFVDVIFFNSDQA
ncbi:hypothetical protein HDU96_007506 [Phlyctochytrium bullatum]|nr:hypothetical protein HDU96_007506 [Phlyctochytrium bullatum]